jgi:anti-sigma regulatory factor (Ser/Thr protein kinase)
VSIGAPSGAAITVSIVRDPALVRTVRLVAASVARRTGRDEEFVEEVRLAVGEACALMVGTEAAEHAADNPGGPRDDTDPVVVTMTLDDRLHVAVSSTRPVPVADEPSSDIDGVEPWALLRGLIDDFEIEQNGTGTRLAMSWPL